MLGRGAAFAYMKLCHQALHWQYSTRAYPFVNSSLRTPSKSISVLGWVFSS